MSVLVGIGGTGQHVAASYLYLAWLTGFDPVPVVVIDNNDEEAKEDENELFTCLKHLKSFEGWFASPVVRFKKPFELPVDGGTVTDLNSLLGDEDEIVTPILGPRASKARQMQLIKGFYGLPTVAVLVAPNGLADGDLREIRGLCEAQGTNRDRVAISASVFGGCGSGTAPRVVRQLATGFRGPIQATLSLQHFLVESVDTRDGSGLAVTDAQMKGNQAATLELFGRDLAEHCRNVILIGLPDEELARIPREKASNIAQPAAPHFLHIVAATEQHLFLSTRLPAAMPAEPFSYFSVPGDVGLRLRDLGPMPNRLLPDFAIEWADAAEGYIHQRPIALGGVQAASVAPLPALNLERWLWVARLTRLLIDHTKEGLEGGRFDGEMDFRDQLRSRGLVADVKTELTTWCERTDRAFKWFREAFFTEDDELRSGLAPDDKDQALDLLSDRRGRADLWQSRKGKDYRDILTNCVRELNLVFDEVTDAEAAGWNAAEGTRHAAGLLIRRARGLAVTALFSR